MRPHNGIGEALKNLLSDYQWRMNYTSAKHNLVSEFYIPALERSVRYDRKAGFFNSAILGSVARGLGAMLSQDGRMRLIMGCQLNPQDLEAMRRGYEMREIVSTRLEEDLTDPTTLVQKQRFELLSWLIAHERLDIRIALPTVYDAKTGRNIVDTVHIFHEKVAIFQDSAGNQIATNGSNNESISGWGGNIESFHAYCGWDGGRDAERVNEEVFAFDEMWNGLAVNVEILEVPEAVRRKLLRFMPSRKPTWNAQDEVVELPEIAPEKPPITAPRVLEVEVPQYTEADLEVERQAFKRLANIHSDPGCLDFCLRSIPVKPWPHQIKILRRVAENFPMSFLIADEVGLGKTVETGLILRYLLVSRKIRRVLILAPASVQSQWLKEMRDKFNLHFLSYSGKDFTDRYGQHVAQAENPWNTSELILASSHLVRRTERTEELLAAEPWDLIVVDEAHHARRKSPQNREDTPNRFLALLRKLKHRTRALALLSATPMQLDPIEIFDLLDLLGIEGIWADGHFFCWYFASLTEPARKEALELWARMAGEYFQNGGVACPRLDSLNKSKDTLLFYRLQDTWMRGRKILNPKQYLADGAFLEASRQYLLTNTPLKDLMFRHTRDTLRQYFRLGLLEKDVAMREVHDTPVLLEAGRETGLYVSVSEYVRHFYNLAAKQKQKALGFLMTLYRKRLTSSFYAIQKSLERRLEGLAFTDDDLVELDDADDGVIDGLEALMATPPDPREVEYLKDILQQFQTTGEDSKLAKFKGILSKELLRHESVIVFTQYTDTMDYLRSFLGRLYGSRLACYSGRGGEVYRDDRWQTVSKGSITDAFAEGKIQVLLCTESASEGLNLQTCGVLINYDLPWNPMRVEQRIGRVDRIGQRYPAVQIYNLIYDGTVEAKVYGKLRERINAFTAVVGNLQPILARVPNFLERAVMSADPEEEGVLLSDLDALLSAPPPRPGIEDMALINVESDLAEIRKPLTPSPIHWQEIERLLTTSILLKQKGIIFERIEVDFWNLRTASGLFRVTFNPDQAGKDKLRFLTYGEPLFLELVGG